ncbi:MAG: (Fe-S)-binding protein [bacterium]
MPESCDTCGIALDNIKIAVEMRDLNAVIAHTNVAYCMECGKCTSTCPVALVNSNFSPRKIVSRTISGGGISLLTSQHIFACLTCGLCNHHCPSDVYFVEFIRHVRELAGIKGNKASCSHGGALQSIMRLMTAPKMKQNRLEWVTDDLKIARKGEYLFFVGCLPYYDSYFADLELSSLNIAKSTVRLLNKLDIVPAVSNDERCCGHDLRWAGDTGMFKLLAHRNAEILSKTGATKIITSCAECFRTLKLDYPDYVDFPFEVFHISEFIAKAIDNKKLQFKNANINATYHDPCRLSRHTDIIDAPRKALKAIEGLKLNEMTHHGKRSNCCGTSSWINCDIHSKMIQVSRLKEAKDTNADLLITSCPKCMIHFKCAQKDAKNAVKLAIDIKDLTEVISENVQ